MINDVSRRQTLPRLRHRDYRTVYSCYITVTVHWTVQLGTSGSPCHLVPVILQTRLDIYIYGVL